jgi:hypothetical protein
MKDETEKKKLKKEKRKKQANPDKYLKPELIS